MLNRLRCHARKRVVFYSLQPAPLHGPVRLLLKDVYGHDEQLEPLVLGLAVVEPVVDLLGDHRKAEEPEAKIEIKVGYA